MPEVRRQQSKLRVPKYCQRCGQPVQPVSKTKFICPNQHKTYLNPVPVGVAILPVLGRGYLLGRRSINPGKGGLAFISGNINADEDVRNGISREVWEEARILTRPWLWRPLHFDSSTGFDRVLLFAYYDDPLPPHISLVPGDGEMSELLIVNSLPDDMAFPLHEEMLKILLEEESYRL